jgi:hypothetical protein
VIYGASVRRLRRLTEAECYARCYGWSDDTVRVIRAERRRGRYPSRLSGEQLRRQFEQRLDRRDAEVRAA